MSLDSSSADGLDWPVVVTAWAERAMTPFGAAAVHATCPAASAVHWLGAHALAPVVAIALLAAPLAWWLGRGTRTA